MAFVNTTDGENEVLFFMNVIVSTLTTPMHTMLGFIVQVFLLNLPCLLHYCWEAFLSACDWTSEARLLAPRASWPRMRSWKWMSVNISSKLWIRDVPHLS